MSLLTMKEKDDIFDYIEHKGGREGYEEVRQQLRYLQITSSSMQDYFRKETDLLKHLLKPATEYKSNLELEKQNVIIKAYIRSPKRMG